MVCEHRCYLSELIGDRQVEMNHTEHPTASNSITIYRNLLKIQSNGSITTNLVFLHSEVEINCSSHLHTRMKFCWVRCKSISNNHFRCRIIAFLFAKVIKTYFNLYQLRSITHHASFSSTLLWFIRTSLMLLLLMRIKREFQMAARRDNGDMLRSESRELWRANIARDFLLTRSHLWFI